METGNQIVCRPLGGEMLLEDSQDALRTEPHVLRAAGVGQAIRKRQQDAAWGKCQRGDAEIGTRKDANSWAAKLQLLEEAPDQQQRLFMARHDVVEQGAGGVVSRNENRGKHACFAMVGGHVSINRGNRLAQGLLWIAIIVQRFLLQ